MIRMQKLNLDNTDYYTRARRCGASHYIAHLFTTYAVAAEKAGEPRIAACAPFLEALDYESFEGLVTALHGVTPAAEILRVMGSF